MLTNLLNECRCLPHNAGILSELSVCPIKNNEKGLVCVCVCGDYADYARVACVGERGWRERERETLIVTVETLLYLQHNSQTTHTRTGEVFVRGFVFLLVGKVGLCCSGVVSKCR